ncbi:G2/mitotic-specific cyclin-B2 [Heteronotia binoei]|uniref:G2/mitotic-specific cyclin-B2 n=1 Tax=Heteronotia binoei TaxID=13085 RepID=UPI00292EF514|nr:G2/mitotic-specific cyclin-B2 [Heteronotia binoei]
MDYFRGARIINPVKIGVKADHSKAGGPASGTRGPLGEISNRLATRRAKAVKKTENFQGTAEGPTRSTHGTTKTQLPEQDLTERHPTKAQPASTTMDVPGEEDLCQAFSEMLLRSDIEDDADDEEDPQLCSDYVKDIYRYLRKLEQQQCVCPFYLDGTELSGRMRAILVDWLVQVHARFHLLPETLYMCVGIMDRYLQAQAVSRKELQLVGVAAMFLASKYEEIYVPRILDFVYITDRAYTSAQIRVMERKILKELGFVLGRPLPLHFLRRAVKVCEATAEVYMLAKYLMELTLVDYDMVSYNPSEIAAAALCLSQKVFSEGHWSPKLCCCTSYEEDSLTLVMSHLAKNVVRVNKNLTQYTAVKTKYTSRRLMRISAISQLNSSTIRDLAAPLLGDSRLLT